MYKELFLKLCVHMLQCIYWDKHFIRKLTHSYIQDTHHSASSFMPAAKHSVIGWWRWLLMLSSHPREFGPCFLWLARSTAQSTASSTLSPVQRCVCTTSSTLPESINCVFLYKAGGMQQLDVDWRTFGDIKHVMFVIHAWCENCCVCVRVIHIYNDVHTAEFFSLSIWCAINS